MATRTFVAVDIGASGGRVVAGDVERGVRLRVVHRFPNAARERDGHLRWDIDHLHHEVAAGLAMVPDAESVGIDTWAVDYGLLDADGNLLAPPIAYRDPRTTDVIERVHALVSPDELFAINGLQHLPFTTLYQLVAEREGPWWERAQHAVLIPDLISLRLTGQLGTELTNASTTGLLDARHHTWSAQLFERLALPTQLLPELSPPGEVRGRTTDGTPVTVVGSHDTASAVAAVPATNRRFAYIVSGTWSLVGLELDRPVLTDAAREANFTNELGVDGRTRFLRNVGGLWLLQECLRAWRDPELDPLLAGAATRPASSRLIDVDSPVWIPPDRMPDRIAAETGIDPSDRPAIVRCVIDSLAEGHARTIRDASKLAGTEVEVVHLVGGGSQNALLCQLTADACGLPVLAGPVEASALGNVLVQARTHGAISGNLDELRQLVAAGNPLRRYDPR